MGSAENVPYEFQPLPKRKIPYLRSINAKRRFFKNKLAQVAQQRKCQRYPEKRLESKEQATDSPGDQSEYLKSLGENYI